MGIIIGLFLAKIVSIAGIGGFIGGFFIKKIRYLFGWAFSLAVLDTYILYSFPGAGVGFPVSFVCALIVSGLLSFLGFFLANRMRKRVTHPNGDKYDGER